MKKIILSGAFALLVSVPFTSLADTQGVLTLVEIPVEAGLAPGKGFDDNDNVQVVLHGTLPNGCYVLADASAEPDGVDKFRLRQRAFKKLTGACKDEATLPDPIKFAVPFTTEISLGNLPAGEYNLTFELPFGKQGDRKLNVAQAPVDSVDSLPYAAVSNAVVREVVSSSKILSVTLTGVLNNSCSRLSDNVKVERVDDVFIVLPVVEAKTGAICTQIKMPFTRKVKLGQVWPGRYLVHVRSMSGKSINRVVEVLK